MKKVLLSFLTGTAMLLTVAASAQNVAVNATGATADPSAMLDVSAAHGGLLVPRINLASLTDATTIASPATSLLVYNTNAALGTGYYYNAGTSSAPSWTKLGGSTSEFWDTANNVLHNVLPGQVSIGNADPFFTDLYIKDTLNYWSSAGFGNAASGTGLVYGEFDATTGADVGYGLGNGIEIGTFSNSGTYYFNNGYYTASMSPIGNFGIGAAAFTYDTALAKLEVKNINGNNLAPTAAGDYWDMGLKVNAVPAFTSKPSYTAGTYLFTDNAKINNVGLFVDAGHSGKYFNTGIIARILRKPKSSAQSVALLLDDEGNTASTAALLSYGKVGINTNPTSQLEVFDGDRKDSTATITGLQAFMAASFINESKTKSTGFFNIGNYSYADGADANFSVFGEAGASTKNNMVSAGVLGYIGQAPEKPKAQSYAVYGYDGVQSSNTYAGVFVGNVFVTGNMDVIGSISKGGGTFKIDHPQDPANKYLIHSFVESPDMMNVYNGNATTDASGNAVVKLPAYFQAENIDFKYQLTVIGQFAQAIIGTEVANNTFTIKTDKPNVKVSWQVTGVRNDKWAQANRVVPEVAKSADDQGKYLYPELYGQPKSAGIHYAAMPSPTSAGKARAAQIEKNHNTNAQSFTQSSAVATGAAEIDTDDAAPAGTQLQQQQKQKEGKTIAPKQ